MSRSRCLPQKSCDGVDLLARLGTGIVTISGGEPLLHPDLDEVIAGIRRRGMIATLITNGYLLTLQRIERLNRAGLDHLQISIDNVVPDEISKKSLKVLDRKLQWLAEWAQFDVTINAVVGEGTPNAEDALVIARRARELGFSATVGIIHDRGGQLLPLDERQRAVVEEIVGLVQVHIRRSRATTASRGTSREESRTNGTAAPARDTSTSAKTAWCTGAHSSAATGIPLERYGQEISSARITPANRVRRSARSVASIESRNWTSCAPIRCKPLPNGSGPRRAVPLQKLPLSVRVTLVDVRDEPAP